MSGMWAILGALCGIIIGLGLALRITVLSIKKSNDIGDSKGDLRDFGTYVNLISTEDDMHKYRPSDRGKIMLEVNCKKAEEQCAMETRYSQG